MAHTLNHHLGFECTCRVPTPARFGAGIRGFVMHAAKQLHSWHQRQRQRQTMAPVEIRILRSPIAVGVAGAATDELRDVLSARRQNTA